MVSGAAISSRGLPSALIPNAISTSPVAGWPARAVAPGCAGGDGAAVPAGVISGPDRRDAGVASGYGAPLDRPVQQQGGGGLAGLPRCGQPPLGRRRLTRRITALLERPGPWTLPRIWRYLGPAAGRHADVVPAGAAGGDLAAAQAGRPRRP